MRGIVYLENGKAAGYTESYRGAALCCASPSRPVFHAATIYGDVTVIRYYCFLSFLFDFFFFVYTTGRPATITHAHYSPRARSCWFCVVFLEPAGLYHYIYRSIVVYTVVFVVVLFDQLISESPPLAHSCSCM